MSSFTVINAVSHRLQEIIWQAAQSSTTFKGFMTSQANICLNDPAEAARDAENRLSLWLYSVSTDPALRNIPDRNASGPKTQQPSPALILSYMITPVGPANEVDTQQQLLGLVMETFHNQPVVLLDASVKGISQELRIAESQLTLEEKAHLWEALRVPYRLSVCYQVKVA